LFVLSYQTDKNPEPIDMEIEDPMKAKEIRSRKDRPTQSIHFGDDDFAIEEEYGDATWSEVFQTCCVHDAKEWGMIFIGICVVVFFLYFFLFGLELLGTGAKVMCGCKAGELFGDDTNPIAGVMVGILSTVLLQSSSTTTSIIVSLVGSAISVQQGIYMVMGANIGTSVTNTIVAIGQMGDGDQLERAFAGATVHDMFNFMTVAILLPVEVVTGYLDALTGALVKNASTEKGDKWEGPIKKLVAPLGDKIIIANKKLIEGIAKGAGSCAEGDGFYPIICEAGEPTYDSCSQVGLIACDKTTGDCPSFFQKEASAKDDKISGGVVFFISICILFTCLIALVTVLQRMLLGMSTRIVYKATDINGYLAILIGCGITIIVQSSSITTSTLTPLVGMGALRLEQMFPLTLGANIGTTVTAIMAAMVTEGTESLQVALAHLFFNITGIFIFYPIPYMRRIPLYAARRLGKATRIWRGFPFVYIAVMFFAVPLVFLGISFLFEEDAKGYTVLGSFIVILLGIGLAWTAYYCQYKGGKEKCVTCMQRREKVRLTNRNLPEDMKYLKSRMAALIEHTGLNEDDLDDDDEEYEDTPAATETKEIIGDIDEDDEVQA
jgi:sodium-dependent phosphate cotransporter